MRETQIILKERCMMYVSKFDVIVFNRSMQNRFIQLLESKHYIDGICAA
jgi:hypothetical protein